MSTDLAPFIQHLRLQAGVCREYGSAFSGDLLEHLARDAERDGPFAGLATPWTELNVRQLFAEAVALRILGALHHLALTRADSELAAIYPTAHQAGQGADLDDLLPRVLLRHPEVFAEFMASPPQTNEVRRSRSVIGEPDFYSPSPRTGLPLRCLEIGASATAST